MTEHKELDGFCNLMYDMYKEEFMIVIRLSKKGGEDDEQIKDTLRNRLANGKDIESDDMLKYAIEQIVNMAFKDFYEEED